VNVEHPELGASIAYPGPFLKASRTPPVIRRRAPLIGEHNDEVYRYELGLSEEEMGTMHLAGVI
jgi:formyl-CoA transferase